MASRIGAVRGDILAVDIQGRSGGRAFDEFVIELSPSHVDLLRNEVHEVDGALVERMELVEPELAGRDDPPKPQGLG